MLLLKKDMNMPDNNVKELNRVLRIINYQHLKNPKDPFTIKCIYLNTDVKYTQEDIAPNAIGCNIDELVSNTKSTEIKPVTVRVETNNLQKKATKFITFFQKYSMRT